MKNLNTKVNAEHSIDMEPGEVFNYIKCMDEKKVNYINIEQLKNTVIVSIDLLKNYNNLNVTAPAECIEGICEEAIEKIKSVIIYSYNTFDEADEVDKDTKALRVKKLKEFLKATL